MQPLCERLLYQKPYAHHVSRTARRYKIFAGRHQATQTRCSCGKQTLIRSQTPSLPKKTACANQRSRSLWCHIIRVIAVSLAVYFLLSEKKKHILPFLWPYLRLFLLLLHCRVVVEEVDIPRSRLVRAHKLLVAWWSCSRNLSAFHSNQHPTSQSVKENQNTTYSPPSYCSPAYSEC
jgi:hypothetical protein